MTVMERETENPKVSEAAKARFLTLDDFWRLKLVSDVQVAPDGTTVAYVVGEYDEGENALRSAIWLAVPGGSTRRFTGGDAIDMQPRWSPDGTRLAFVSTRHEGKPQVYLIERDGGEPRRLTSGEHGATSPVWSPDGKTLCYSVALPSDRQEVASESEWLAAHENVDSTGSRLRRQTTLMSRFDGRGYVDKRMHLFVLSVDDPETEPRQLTDGDVDDAAAAWSPDGRHIAFLSNREERREHMVITDIWTVDVETGDLHRLTESNLMAEAPSWSPNSRTLAFYAAPDWSTGHHDAHLWLVSLDGGQRDASAALDRGHRHVQPDYHFPAHTPPVWSPGGESVYFTVIDHGDDAVYSLTVSSGEIERLSAAGTDIQGLQCAGDGEGLVLLACRPDHPFDVFTMPVSGGTPEPMVGTNSALLTERRLIEPQRVTASGPGGWEIEGWLYLPEDVESPPLVLHVHGGPYGAWGDSFYLLAQVLACQGYASLYVNPRGSLGYGQSFSEAADWGEDDFRDLMAVVDAVVGTHAVDRDRLAITGISYGGFITNWALGHSDRFKTGVSVNGVSNQISMFGVSDISALWLPVEFDGAFWESEDAWQRYRHHSPLSSVDRISAPLLLIQSENDYRCPIDQGEQMLTALRARHQTVELIRFPGCSHVIAESGTPLQRYLQWKITLDWFAQYL